jgi:hypothetical protein
MKAIKFITAILLISLFTTGNVLAQSNKSSAKPATGNTYLVKIQHTPEQCMKVMNGIGAKGSAYLSEFRFGCMSGDHTAYAFLKGSSEEAVLKTLPADVQSMAKIEKVDKYTPEQLEKMHKNM